MAAQAALAQMALAAGLYAGPVPGDKRMPDGLQSSKYLVSTAVLREALRVEPSDIDRDIQTLRLEQALITQRLEALRKLVRPLVRRRV